MAAETQKIIRIDNVRLSFPQIWDPVAMNEGDKAACSAQFIMPPDGDAAKKVKAAMQEVAKAAWGDNGAEVLKQLIGQERVCLRKGDTKTDATGQPLEGYAGNLFLSARSYRRPTVFDKDKSPLTEADGKPYSGCYVNAQVAIWAQKGGQYGKRVNAQLQGVQFAGDGESFAGGGVASADSFETLGDEFGTDDELGSGPQDDDLLA